MFNIGLSAIHISLKHSSLLHQISVGQQQVLLANSAKKQALPKNAAVSQVSAVAGVRARMVERQRAVGRRGRVVMVGRDIGTVVMPDAPLKLYVVATAEERARRRLRDRLARGHDDDYAAILADVIRRDHIDSTRRHSPLRPAADSIVIDTTGRRVDELLHEVLSLLNEVAA